MSQKNFRWCILMESKTLKNIYIYIFFVITTLCLVQTNVQAYTPSQQGAYTFGVDRFSPDYAVGYFAINNSSWHNFRTENNYCGAFPGRLQIVIENWGRDGNRYIDHYNQAVYNGEYLDIREYVWIWDDQSDDGNAIIWADNGGCGAKGGQSNFKLIREFHFYKGGTLQSGNPQEVWFKGLMQLEDLDNDEGWAINNLNRAYLSNDTTVTKTGGNTWKGTYEPDQTEMYQRKCLWVEVQGGPGSPLVVTYIPNPEHYSAVNFDGSQVQGKIIYDPNGGSGSRIDQIMAYGYQTQIKGQIYQRTDYTFRGWNTDPNGNGAWYSPDGWYTFGGQLTLYAQWSAETYVVKFNGAGATSGWMGDQTIQRGVNTPLNKNQFKREFDVTFDPREGTCNISKTHSVSQFRRWEMNGRTFADQQWVMNLAPANSFATLYAQWEDKYIILPEAKRPGYTLEGWYMTGRQGTEIRVGTEGDKFLVDGNYTLYAKYVKPSGRLAAVEDAKAANNHGGTKLQWHFTGLPKNYTYKLFQAQADQSEYLNIVNDPQKWNPVQVIDLTKKAEPIYVLNIIPAQEYNFGDTRTGDPKSDMRRTYTFPEYDWDGYPTGKTYTVNMAQFGALKVWMEGGTIDVLHTYKTYANWVTVANPLQYNVKYDAYGASPYTGQQIIRVIPVYLQDINKNPSQYLRYDESTKTWKIKVNMNALYDPNGREVELSEIFIGTRDGNGSANQEQVNQPLVTMIQKFLDTGGQVVAGHDTIGWDRQVQTNALQSIRSRFKVWTALDDPDKIPIYSAYGQTDVIVTKSGIITNFPYELKLGTHLTVPYCHTIRNSSYGTVWMEFNENNLQAPADDAHYPGRDKIQGNPLYYLTSNGNAAMIQTGHSMCESTPDERKVIANLLFYLKQTQDAVETTDNSSQDFESPDAVDQNKADIEFVSASATDVTIQRPKDSGTWYTHVAQVFQNNDIADEFSLQNGNLCTQNFVSTEVTQGLQGYYMYIDDKPTGNISYVNGQITQMYGDSFSESNANVQQLQNFRTIYRQDINIDYSERNVGLEWGGNLLEVQANQDSDIDKTTKLQLDTNSLRAQTSSSEVWIHIISYDAAGNIQTTQNIKVSLARITYNANGGIGDDVYQPIGINAYTVIRENMFTRDDYRFIKWNASPDGQGQDYIELKTYRFNQSITLYAQWEKINKLTVDPNKGLWTDNHDIVVDPQILNPNIDTEATGKTYDKPIQFDMGRTDKKDIDDAYNRPGYNFSGWMFNN